jgi:DNA-binding NtrC family response regulator
MTLGALRCQLAAGGGSRLDVSAWAGSLPDLLAADGISAYLVVEETLESLRGQSAFNDRGRKHSARSLSALLIGRPRVPIVRATFRSRGQLARSVRNLLEHAARRRERKTYVIGIPPVIFEEMAAAVPVATGDAIASRTASTDSDFVLIDPEHVPPDLEARVVGTSREIRIVRQWIVRAARHQEPVLVLGDTGTGKDLVARSIHLFDPVRRLQPFVAVNCGAIPGELFESEVFGYVAGAFTNASRKGSIGLWRSANGGTLFLDEIAELPLARQAKLLRVLEHKVIRPVGATQEIRVDARVIAATNRDLYSMMRAGEFREDLYYRLGATILTLPRLRDRAEDIPALADCFWREIAPGRPPLARDVLQELRLYRWPGNARELRYILVNLHTTFPGTPPTVAHLRTVLRMRLPAADRAPQDGGEEALLRIDRLRHLRRTRAAIEACQRSLRAFSRHERDTDQLRVIRSDMVARLTELELLIARPERFETPATLQALQRLAGSVAVFCGLLEGKDLQAPGQAVKGLTGDTTSAAAAVRRDEERILRSL